MSHTAEVHSFISQEPITKYCSSAPFPLDPNSIILARVAWLISLDTEHVLDLAIYGSSLME
jgi:hypothetical protein